MSLKKQIFLVDASSVFFRAYYAVPFMMARKNSKNPLHTNAVYGYLTTTLKILDTFKPQYIVYCFDRREASHRVEYYKDYKANREEMPEDLEEQMPYIQKVTDFLGIKRMDKKKYEADDLIGSLVFWAKKNKAQVVIISSDKDFAQLVCEDVHLFDPMKEIRYDTVAVQKKWGVLPNQIVDYLAIVGDVSDNIPGVKGIGPKGARKLFSQYKTLENIYDHLDEIPDRLVEKLRLSKKEAFLSQKLARIVTDLDLVSDFKDIKCSPLQKSKMEKLLSELEFSSIKRKLFSKKAPPAVSVSSNSSVPSSYENSHLERIIKDHPHLKKMQKWTLNDLFTNLHPYEEVGIVLLENKAHLLLKKSFVEISTQSWKKLGQILSRKKIKWWGYDLKSIWKKCEVENPIATWDLMVAVHLVTSKPSSHFKNVIQEFFYDNFDNEENSIFYLFSLRKIFQKKLEDENLKFIYENIELKMISVLYRMEKEGVLLDAEKLNREGKNFNYDLLDLENKIFSLSGHPFNISSPQQLAGVLFDEMGLRKGRKTKTGYSTGGDVLQSLESVHPIIRFILDYREIFKLKTTYVDSLLNAIDGKTHRVHTHFKQTLTATGRLSSVHPNLQNIPIKTKRGRKIRESFISSPEKILISADYSQIELRILAHFSDDPYLKKAFADGEDIHKATAAEIFNIPIHQVSEDERRSAKTVNFGITYGQTAFSLSENLGIDHSQAQEIIDRYFERFKNVKTYISDSLKSAGKKGYVETLFGRKRFIPELFAKNTNTKKLGERMAINAIIQGTASDIVKMAMIQLDESLWAKMLLQVHDELLFECLKEDKEEEMKKIQDIMESTVSLNVPLQIHIGSGKNWDKAGKA